MKLLKHKKLPGTPTRPRPAAIHPMQHKYQPPAGAQSGHAVTLQTDARAAAAAAHFSVSFGLSVVLLAIKKRIAHCVNLLLAGGRARGRAVARPAHAILLYLSSPPSTASLPSFLPPSLPLSSPPSLSLFPFGSFEFRMPSLSFLPLPLLFIHSAATTGPADASWGGGTVWRPENPDREGRRFIIHSHFVSDRQSE